MYYKINVIKLKIIGFCIVFSFICKSSFCQPGCKIGTSNGITFSYGSLDNALMPLKKGQFIEIDTIKLDSLQGIQLINGGILPVQDTIHLKLKTDQADLHFIIINNNVLNISRPANFIICDLPSKSGEYYVRINKKMKIELLGSCYYVISYFP